MGTTTKVASNKAAAATKRIVTTTVPPTREVPERVVYKYSETKKSMGFQDKKQKTIRKEWHALVRGKKLVVIEGFVGTELTQTVEEFDSPEEAAQALETRELEKYAQAWSTPGSGSIFDAEFFHAPPPKATKAPTTGAVDATPAPAAEQLAGYASDGRMLKDMESLLSDIARLPRTAAGSITDLEKHLARLPAPTQKAMLGIAAACKSGRFRELQWSLTLGSRLAADYDDHELAELFGGNKKWVELGKTAIEIAHDGGLAHYVACTDGVRVYNNEGSFEAVITPSVDAFMWALVHRTAVAHGSYDAKAYKQSLRKLGIKRELTLER